MGTPEEISAKVKALPGSRDIPKSQAKSLYSKMMNRAETLVSNFDIGHLLILLFGLHLFALSFPSGSEVFDEAPFYVPAAQDLLNLVPSNLEHPFFGKIWGALGIYLFGNDFFGWRIFYVVIGVLAVYVMYLVALNFVSKQQALLAACFLGFETLFFIHTSLLLLEGPPILFALIGFLAYFKRRFYISAFAMGLSVLSKEWGVFFAFALILYHLYAMPKHNFWNIVKRNAAKLAIFFAITILTFALPMWAYDIIYKPVGVEFGPITNPLQNLLYYYHFQSLLTNCSGISAWNCYPWNWILPFNIEPLNYYMNSSTLLTIHWEGIGNFAVWYAIWPITGVLLYKILTKKFRKVDAFIGFWIVSTYLPWYYISLVLHRVEFAYYFVNVDPALALGIPVVISSIVPDRHKMLRNAALIAWLLAVLYLFVLFFPVRV